MVGKLCFYEKSTLPLRQWMVETISTGATHRNYTPIYPEQIPLIQKLFDAGKLRANQAVNFELVNYVLPPEPTEIFGRIQLLHSCQCWYAKIKI